MTNPEPGAWKPERVIEISKFLHQEWYWNEQIVAYVLYAMNRQTLQVWTDKALETLRAWTFPKPYRALHDLSHHGVVVNYSLLTNTQILNIGIQPTARQTVKDFIKTLDGFSARVAVNLSSSFSGDIGRLLADSSTYRHMDPMVEYRVFVDREKALEWLMG